MVRNTHRFLLGHEAALGDACRKLFTALPKVSGLAGCHFALSMMLISGKINMKTTVQFCPQCPAPMRTTVLENAANVTKGSINDRITPR